MRSEERPKLRRKMAFSSVQLKDVHRSEGTADAEVNDPSVENPELKGSSFKAWNRYVY